ncbi:hypothetical protein [Niallia sp. 01092]|uniref:hypothetical protein n=1 Tax=unclassified Niallia TaxID=2837522 RepID=UPI003FD5479D
MEYLLTNIGLMDCLKDKIKEAIKDFRMSTGEGQEKVPKVSIQFLEEKPVSRMKKQQEVEREADYPHVVIRFLEEREVEGTPVVEVRIIAGIHCDDVQQAHLDLLNLLNRIKIHLVKNKLMASFNMRKDSYVTVIPEEQEHPYWIGFSNIQYNLQPIRFEGDVDFG